MRELYEKWNANLSRMFNRGTNVVIDEQMIGFRGRCPFKQYLPKKPTRYGIKVWALCDCTTSFVWKTDVYTGRAPNTKAETNQGKRVVLQLTEGLKGHQVIADNFFSNYDLVVELSKRQLSFLGTVRKNKTFIPPKLLDVKKKPVHHSEFVFDNQNKISMVSYIPKKKQMRPID